MGPVAIAARCSHTTARSCRGRTQRSFASATERWPTTGVPANPAGWLYSTASRVVLGQLRSEAIHGRKARLLAVSTDWIQPTATDDIGDLHDERLALILLCCHPALHPAARSPLARTGDLPAKREAIRYSSNRSQNKPVMTRQHSHQTPSYS